jgi:hypothetical protein
VGGSYTARPECPSMSGVACLNQTQDAVWFLAESSSRQPSVATTFRNAASTEVHSHSPVPPFPHPAGLDGSGSPWASPACSRTPRYRGACAVWEPTWHKSGAMASHHGPLIWCDFVSHALHEILATSGQYSVQEFAALYPYQPSRSRRGTPTKTPRGAPSPPRGKPEHPLRSGGSTPWLASSTAASRLRDDQNQQWGVA